MGEVAALRIHHGLAHLSVLTAWPEVGRGFPVMGARGATSAARRSTVGGGGRRL